MKSMDDLLSEHAFFRELDPAHRSLVAGCGSNVYFEAGAYLFRADEDAARFFALRQGKAALEVFSPGRGPIVIETIGAGDVLGWSWLFPPYRWQFDGRAVEPVHAIAFDGTCLRGKCEADPGLGWNLAKKFSQIMVRRLQATRLQLVDLYGDALRS